MLSERCADRLRAADRTECFSFLAKHSGALESQESVSVLASECATKGAAAELTFLDSVYPDALSNGRLGALIDGWQRVSEHEIQAAKALLSAASRSAGHDEIANAVARCSGESELSVPLALLIAESEKREISECSAPPAAASARTRI